MIVSVGIKKLIFLMTSSCNTLKDNILIEESSDFADLCSLIVFFYPCFFADISYFYKTFTAEIFSLLNEFMPFCCYYLSGGDI